MGNCLKSPTADDVSLLRDGNNGSSSGDDGQQQQQQQQLQQQQQQQQQQQHQAQVLHSGAAGGGGGGNERGAQDNSNAPVYYPSPNVSRPASQLTEEEQVRIAQRMGLIQHLPVGVYDGSKKNRECVICMIEFVIGDRVRYLPCMHTYHTDCIDDWLMRSFTCPSCMEPVDAALLVTYEAH